MAEKVLTIETLRRAFELSNGIPKKHYYPIHPNEWEEFLKYGYKEKQLIDMGFIKATYIEV